MFGICLGVEISWLVLSSFAPAWLPGPVALLALLVELNWVVF